MKEKYQTVVARSLRRKLENEDLTVWNKGWKYNQLSTERSIIFDHKCREVSWNKLKKDLRLSQLKEEIKDLGKCRDGKGNKGIIEYS